MAEVTLKAKKREISTKGAINQARKSGKVPGVFYIKGQEGIPILVEENDINPLVFTSESHLIQLKIEGDSADMHESILKEIQFDPVTDKVVHFDLRGITRGEVLELEIPLVLRGTAVGVKEGGVLQQTLHKLQIECLPRHIPEHLEFDVSNLKFGESITIADLSFENVKILNPVKAVVLSIVAPKIVDDSKETEEESAEEINEPEVIKKGKAEDETDE
ncbi:MAG: 50S ribosomal protein L25 [Melioribacteraceae bacterium]|nr:50S ribosomal protein L25 [Melioribacteraceae bacterium]RJP59680.1 MAG: 50S ribosomal protein L25 [Ignavibacteriales bacterium]WKZ68569.1 MAG: 50S ribosomal protein L25 [Melioribacteraceae bacterium]